MEKTRTDTGPLRERNRQRTHERIVKAADELFRLHGYDNTTMDEIAAMAQVSRATLFNYFPTKDALLVPFVEQVLEERIRPSLSQYLSDSPDAFHALRHLFMCVYRFVLVVPEIDRALKREFLRTEHLSERKSPTDRGFLTLLMEVLIYGQGRGEIRSDIDAEKQADYLGALFGTLILNALLKAEISDYPHEVDTLVRFLRSGLQPADKGV